MLRLSQGMADPNRRLRLYTTGDLAEQAWAGRK
jgi:hypothetical protein